MADVPRREPVAEPVLLHLHLPKTGGESLIQLIWRFHAGSPRARSDDGFLRHGIYYYPRGIEEDSYARDIPVPEGDAPPAPVLDALKRADVTVVSGHFAFGLHRYLDRPFRYVTILRDPVARVVSLYHHARRVDHNPEIHRLVSDATLEEFVADFGYKQADNGQTRRIAGAEPPFGGCTTETLALAKHNLEHHFSAVGVLERYEESVDCFAHRLRWDVAKAPDGLAHGRRNVNPERPAVASLPSRTVRMIREHNELDLELYDRACALLSGARSR